MSGCWVVRTIYGAAAIAALALVTTPGTTQTPAPGISIGDAVTVSGSTSHVSVVSIPMPRDFPADSRVAYVVIPRSEGIAIGRLSGVITTLVGSVSPVLFGIRAARYASAGSQEVARVRFSSPSRVVDVPVFLVVETVRNILVSAHGMSVGRAGAPASIAIRLTNDGNAPDTVALEAIVPAGWRAADPPAPVVLQPHATTEQALTVVPPPNANGPTAIRVIAHARGTIVAESMADVQVAGVASMTSSAAGPRVTLGLATAVGPWGGYRTLRVLDARGSLSDGLTIAARTAVASEADGAGYAFSRANMAPTPLTMQLSSPDWRVDAGVLGVSLSNLTGANLVGRGASANVSHSRWNATAIAASPDLGYGAADGALRGARLEFIPAQTVSLSASASRLREWRGSSSRELDAMALGAGLTEVLGGRFDAELAGRRVDGRALPGWATEYAKRTADETFTVRYVHAPGGNRAFARAASELAASAGRRLSSRLSVTGSMWSTADDGAPTTSAIRMDGWTAGAQYAVRPDIGVTIGARQSALSATTSLGAFGSEERGADGAVDVRRGVLLAQLGFAAARVSRRTTPDASQVSYRREAGRAGIRGALGSALGTTAVSVTGHYERTGPGVGAAPVQWSYGFHVSGTPGFGEALRIEASAEQLGGAEGASRALTMHAGAELTIARHTVLNASVERNPYVLPRNGAGEWMYVLGVARSVALPRWTNHGTRGRLFRDLNGNGHADHGEPGFAGIVLRRGSATAVSDARGAFTLDGDERQPYEIDARSLPVGWLLSSTMVPGSTREIPVIAVATLTVRLGVDDADTARVPRAEVARVNVIMREASGREWAGRRSADSIVVFDALPPGRYQLIVDASGAREPLQMANDPGVITIVAGRAPPEQRVLLRARPLRFSNPKRDGS